jgi:hypothetical protein
VFECFSNTCQKNPRHFAFKGLSCIKWLLIICPLLYKICFSSQEWFVRPCNLHNCISDVGCRTYISGKPCLYCKQLQALLAVCPALILQRINQCFYYVHLLCTFWSRADIDPNRKHCLINIYGSRYLFRCSKTSLFITKSCHCRTNLVHWREFFLMWW